MKYLPSMYTTLGSIPFQKKKMYAGEWGPILKYFKLKKKKDDDERYKIRLGKTEGFLASSYSNFCNFSGAGI